MKAVVAAIFGLLCLLFGFTMWASGIGVLVTLIAAFVSLVAPELITVSFWIPAKLVGVWIASLIMAALSAGVAASAQN